MSYLFKRNSIKEITLVKEKEEEVIQKRRRIETIFHISILLQILLTAFWTTRIMAESFGREVLLEATLREMIIFVIFIILVTVVSVGMVSKSRFYLTRVMEQQFIEQEFSTVNDVDITFTDIRTAADFWHYAESVLTNNLYWGFWYEEENPVVETADDDKKIQYQNQLLGVPRLRQLKVRNDSCTIHPVFRKMFLSCYATYSRQTEDTNSFGPEGGTAWTYSSSGKTGSLPYKGEMSHYDGGGFYQDLSLDKEKTTNIIDSLKQNLWITRGTRVIFLDFTTYNANVNLFCVMKIIFEFPPTGGIRPSHQFRSVKLIRYESQVDYLIMACEILFTGFVIFYLIEEIREVSYLRWRYFMHFWNYIDLIILTLSFCSIIFSVIRLLHANGKLKELQKNKEKYENFESVIQWQIHFNNLIAIMVFFVYVKIFKYMNFNKAMGQLNNTLKRCAMDILGFSLMFFIIFFAFAALGYLLFGTQVETFSGFGIAMFTLLRTILGDFDYSEIEKANRFFAPIYFVSYIFFVFFVLLNMFLAIINDTYTEVKTELVLAPEEMQMMEFIKRGFFNFLRKCGCGKWAPIKRIKKNEYSIAIESIRGFLKKCDFTDVEIEMFFTRYDIDPTLDVGEFDLNKLMADLEEPPDRKGRKFKSQKDPTANINQYLKIDQRLNEMEQNVNLLTDKLDTLLNKLGSLEGVKKIPK